MPSQRILIVANRLPATVRTGANGIELAPSSGGLATGLRPWHQRANGIWFGWPGELSALSDEQRGRVDEQMRAAGMAPIPLTPEQVERYYHGFANRVLWPLFHYSVDRMPLDASGWAEYQDVNLLFANEVAREYRSGDIIWIHDYHLMLLPALLRQRLPHARIGFFLHIPFPSSEVFRVLPWRRELLNGLLGADLVGFHTFSYMRHFMKALVHVNGVEANIDRVRVRDREVQVGVFPMGVDAPGFAALTSNPDVRARIDDIKRDAGGRRIILGIDRLDYTKGIPGRLEAIAHLLERNVALRDQIRYIQIAVPSRGEVDSYQTFRKSVDETVGRMNGEYGTLHSLPIHYIHQTVSPHELTALYCAADVMLVTPLRDGMNLVAKEFAASRVDEDGVLILSEFAGASAELQGALAVNPFDTQSLADNIQRALAMPYAERRARMRALRSRVCACDAFAWANGFVQRLERVPHESSRVCAPPLTVVLGEARRTKAVRLLLDYDGTLVPLARTPELAVPDADLLRLLDDLADTPGIDVDIVSGRPRESLARWFAHLSISLWAEHGLWRRRRGCDAWEATLPLDADWIARVHPLLEQFAASTPGAFVETKTASLAWHFRESPREFGLRQAHELQLLLGDLLANQPLEILEGKKVIEVRARGVNKGLAAQRIQAEGSDSVVMVAIGDDRTDDDLFRAMPPGAISVAVGPAATAARYRVESYRNVRQLLRSLVEGNPTVRGSELRQAVSA
jgi:trehalose 6-phosphate synthase/phosphatase